MKKRWFWNKAVKPEKQPVESLPFPDIDRSPLPYWNNQTEEPVRKVTSVIRFVALTDFYSPENQAWYKRDRPYSLVHTNYDHPNSDAVRLKAVLPLWESDGRIRIESEEPVL